MEFTPEPLMKAGVDRHTPTINHAYSAFIENKRYRIKPRATDDVVNRNAVSVYQTDAVLILAGGVQRRRSGAPTTKTVQSTSMSNKMYLALLAGASFLDAGLHQAVAIDAAPVSEPTVIYADQPAQRPAAPVRMASADQSNMGGGFIQFLFGDAPPQSDRYRQ